MVGVVMLLWCVVVVCLRDGDVCRGVVDDELCVCVCVCVGCGVVVKRVMVFVGWLCEKTALVIGV